MRAAPGRANSNLLYEVLKARADGRSNRAHHDITSREAGPCATVVVVKLEPMPSSVEVPERITANDSHLMMAPDGLHKRCRSGAEVAGQEVHQTAPMTPAPDHGSCARKWGLDRYPYPPRRSCRPFAALIVDLSLRPGECRERSVPHTREPTMRDRSTTPVQRKKDSETEAGSAEGTQRSSGVLAQLRGHDYDVQMRMLSPVQRDTGGGTTAGVHAAAERGIAGAGGQLPHYETIQAAFGSHDVSGVKSHVGGAASEATAAMGASAYATGNSVAFGSAPDLHTAAHEAAHIVQQRAGVSLYGGVGKAGDSYEQHADRVADAVVSGQSAQGLLDSVTGGGGGGGVQRRAVQRKSDKDLATEQEAADGGHSLLRHGPELTDATLKRRLTTGMTAKLNGPGETYSPAPGLVTRFKTYDDYNKTRQAATDAANKAIGETKKGMKSVVEAWAPFYAAGVTAKTNLAKAKADLKAAPSDATAKTAMADAGKAFADANKDKRTASDAVKTQAATFDAAGTAGISITCKVNQNSANAWDWLTIKPSYGCVVAHGRTIGVGFRGQGAETKRAPTDENSTYAGTSAQLDVDRTQTAFSTSKTKLEACSPTQAASWKAGQHYPCDPGKAPGMFA